MWVRSQLACLHCLSKSKTVSDWSNFYAKTYKRAWQYPSKPSLLLILSKHYLLHKVIYQPIALAFHFQFIPISFRPLALIMSAFLGHLPSFQRYLEGDNTLPNYDVVGVAFLIHSQFVSNLLLGCQ
jgi:hypothetical protein